MKFGGIPDGFSLYESSSIVIVPVPFDATSTWGKGADKGPEAMLHASENMELYDIDTDTEVWKRGIFTAGPLAAGEADPERMTGVVQSEVRRFLRDGKFPVIVGGNHSVSIGAFYAFAERFSPLTILQLDAHADLRDSYEGSKFNHACVMARAGEVAKTVQVGIRSMCDEEVPSIDRETTFFARQMLRSSSWQDEVVKKLGEHVYMTIDLDVLDPSVMPSTGTPEPGGIGYYDILDLVDKVIGSRNLAGFDVVELSPVPGLRGPEFLAAKLIYQILSKKFQYR